MSLTRFDLSNIASALGSAYGACGNSQYAYGVDKVVDALTQMLKEHYPSIPVHLFDVELSKREGFEVVRRTTDSVVLFHPKTKESRVIEVAP